MDERDITLLKTISDLGTGSPDRLHEETGIPVSTIHYRLNNLREAGIIENDLYDVDLDAVGLGVTVIVADYEVADYESSDEVAESLLAIEGVTQLYFTMGETDFVIIARLPDSDDVERLIGDFQSNKAVKRTNSTYVISTLRDSSRPLQSYSLESLIEALAEE
jgi:DNA-binding Lrp family transcriptional regulator